MNPSKQELRFGDFEKLSPEDLNHILSCLQSGSRRLELYWEKAARTKLTGAPGLCTPVLQVSTKRTVSPLPTEGSPSDTLKEQSQRSSPAAAPSEVTPQVVPQVPANDSNEPSPPASQYLCGGPAMGAASPEAVDPPVEPSSRPQPSEQEPMPPQPVPTTPASMQNIQSQDMRTHEAEPYVVQTMDSSSQTGKEQVDQQVSVNTPTPVTTHSVPKTPTESMSSQSSASLLLQRTHERRNKKRRPPDYYKQFENQEHQPPPHMQHVSHYPQMASVSVRQVMESPSGYNVTLATPQTRIMPSQYGPVSYASVMPAGMMNMQMQLQFQQQQQHYMSTQAQDMARVAGMSMASFPQHPVPPLHHQQQPQPHYAPQHQPEVFHPQQHLAGPPLNVRAIHTAGPRAAMPQRGHSPSHAVPVGRSPPRGTPGVIPAGPYQGPNAPDSQSILQPSAQVPFNVQVNPMQASLQNITRNSSSSPNTSLNKFQKDVKRTAVELTGAPVVLPASSPEPVAPVKVEVPTSTVKPVSGSVSVNNQGTGDSHPKPAVTKPENFTGTLTFGTVQDIATMKAQSPPSRPRSDEDKEPVTPDPVGSNDGLAVSNKTPDPSCPAPLTSVTCEPSSPKGPPPAQVPSGAEAAVQTVTEGRPTVEDTTKPLVSQCTTDKSVSPGSAAKSKALHTAVAEADTAPAPGPPSKPAEAEPPAPPVKPPARPSAWADLFKTSNTRPSPGIVVSEPRVAPQREKSPADRVSEPKEEEPRKPVEASKDGSAKQLGEKLLKYSLNYQQVSLQPRGLYNQANWCYINATLQALLACPPFCHLMRMFPTFQDQKRGPSSTPVTDCLVEFVNEFSEMLPTQLKMERAGNKGPTRNILDIRHGQPFEPKNVYKMLQVIQYDVSFKHGRQEDAEEFLGCILNALHDEMVASMTVARETSPSGEERVSENGDIAGDAAQSNPGATPDAVDDDDQWEQVGPKNKSVVTRSAKISKSPISALFGGQIRSILHQQGLKESATLQPFFTLQLDIQHEKVRSVTEALEALVSKEAIQGFTDSTTKQEVEATRRIMLEELPPVLILHIKCFVYDKSGGCQKLVKPIDFPIDLNISKDLLSPNAKSKYHKSRDYKLFAVVNHHGPRAMGGHYTADIYHSGINGWIHSDDSMIKVVTPAQVLRFAGPKVPYLLYYKRKDLV